MSYYCRIHVNANVLFGGARHAMLDERKTMIKVQIKIGILLVYKNIQYHSVKGKFVPTKLSKQC